MACLLMLYAPSSGREIVPDSELMLTMRPFEAITSGANAFVTRNTPYTFTYDLGTDTLTDSYGVVWDRE